MIGRSILLSRTTTIVSPRRCAGQSYLLCPFCVSPLRLMWVCTCVGWHVLHVACFNTPKLIFRLHLLFHAETLFFCMSSHAKRLIVSLTSFFLRLHVLDARTNLQFCLLRLHVCFEKAVVMDVGSGWTRMGLAGQEKPSCVFPTIVGRMDLRAYDRIAGQVSATHACLMRWVPLELLHAFDVLVGEVIFSGSEVSCLHLLWLDRVHG